jgi:WD40 repeat protein
MNQTGLSQTDTFYITGGNVPADALSYVTRDADALLLPRLLQGQFCYILTSRQMGKSSLMTQMVKRLREHHVAPAVLDLSNQGFNLDARQWYNGLLEQLGRRLKLDDEIEDFCREHRPLSPLQLWQQALRDVVLEAMPDQQVVIFIDEIDVVRSLPFSTDEFFAAIRACYNARTEDPTFARLSFCLLGVATPADLISNPKLTPFNIGTRIELTDFSREEARSLEVGLGLNMETNCVLMDRIIYWTSGHPYLTQRLCQAVAADDAHLTAGSVDSCAARLFLSVKAQRQDSNLSFVQQRMLPSEEEQRVGLLTLYAKVLSGKSVLDSDTVAYVSELKLAGIVQAVGGRLVVRNRIYSQVFDRAWINENMPGAELRRQQAAYRRGLYRAGAVASAIVGVMGCLTLWAIRSQQQANHYRVKAEQAASAERTLTALAEQQRKDAERTAYFADMKLISDAYEAKQYDRIGELLDETKQERYRPYRGFEWGYWNRLRRLNLLKPQEYTVASFSEDTPTVTSDGAKATNVRVIQNDQQTLMLQGTKSYYCPLVAFSPDGTRIVAYLNFLLMDGFASAARVWNARTGQVILTLKGHNDRIADPVYAVAFSPDSQRIVTGGISLETGEGEAKIWDTQTGRNVLKLKGHKLPVVSVAYSSDGTRIVTGSDDRTSKVWDARTGQEILTLKGHKESVTSVAFSPNGKHIVTGSGDLIAKVWDVQTGREILTLKGHEKSITSVAYSPDGTWIVTGSNDNTAKVWDAQTGREYLTLVNHTMPVVSVAFSPDSRRIVIGSGSGAHLSDESSGASVWNVQAGRETLVLPVNGGVSSVAFSSDGKRIVTGGVGSVMDGVSDDGKRRPIVIEGGGSVKVWFSDPDD